MVYDLRNQIADLAPHGDLIGQIHVVPLDLPVVHLGEPVVTCVSSDTASEERWKNALLGYEEMPDYPAQITGRDEAV